jgi:hypothetical protein
VPGAVKGLHSCVGVELNKEPQQFFDMNYLPMPVWKILEHHSKEWFAELDAVKKGVTRTLRARNQPVLTVTKDNNDNAGNIEDTESEKEFENEGGDDGSGSEGEEEKGDPPVNGQETQESREPLPNTEPSLEEAAAFLWEAVFLYEHNEGFVEHVFWAKETISRGIELSAPLLTESWEPFFTASEVQGELEDDAEVYNEFSSYVQVINFYLSQTRIKANFENIRILYFFFFWQ